MTEQMRLAALITALVSSALGVAAALATIRGTQSTPWAIQSYSGESEAEKAFRNKGKWWFRVGLVSLAGAFLFAAASAVCSYLAS